MSLFFPANGVCDCIKAAPNCCAHIVFASHMYIGAYKYSCASGPRGYAVLGRGAFISKR